MQKMFGNPIDPIGLPDSAVILQPHWQYSVKRSRIRRYRICCNGSKNAAPQLHAVASTWSSCVELPVQWLFLGIAADLGLTIFGGDATDAYAHSTAPSETHLAIDDAYADWYWDKFGTEINRKHVLPVYHCLQGHPELGKMWMHFIDNIIIDQMGFKNTTNDRCIYWKVIDDEVIYLLRMVDDCIISCKSEQMARNIFNIIGEKMRFPSEKEKGIIHFEFLGVVNDYNGVDIKQTSHYIEMSCQNYIHCLCKSHEWDVDTALHKDEMAFAINSLFDIHSLHNS